MKKIIINSEFFTKRIPRLINKFNLSKFSFESIDLFNDKPCIYISPRTSIIDYNLISKCINAKFVFIKSSVISQINLGSIKQKQLDELLKEMETLSGLGYSFAFCWNNSPTIFGENTSVSENMALFLKKTNLDVKFLTFPGLYFCQPMWAKKPRTNKIFASQQITIKNYMLKGLSEKEIIKTFINSTPSSATAYANKYPVNMKSNTRANGLESIMYACPNCKSLLTLYSEFSCLKCKNCGSAFEVNEDGKILFAKHISSFDDIDNFQFKALTRRDLNKNELITYENLTQISSENCKKPLKNGLILQIYPEKLIFKNKENNKSKEIYFEDIEYANLTFGKLMCIKPKNAKQFYFCGNNNENLLIIKDLVKLNKN